MVDGTDIGSGHALVEHLIEEAYLPFADELRAIPWPKQEGRMENDAEHSFSLAFIGAALGEQIGLDPAKISLYATYHDFVERYAGDTSVWDETGQLSKHEREQAALDTIRDGYTATPLIHRVIEEYEKQESEEARFVYALDKLLPVIMIIQAEGSFWKNEGITHSDHLAKVEVVRPKIASHPTVLKWYDSALSFLDEHHEHFFAPNE